MAGQSGEKAIDVSQVKSWKQVAAIVVGYAFVQIVTSMNPATAPYSFASLGILGFLVYFIIRKDYQFSSARLTNVIELQIENLISNIELLKELRDDMTRKEQTSPTQEDKKLYAQIINELDIRLRTYGTLLDRMKRVRT